MAPGVPRCIHDGIAAHHRRERRSPAGAVGDLPGHLAPRAPRVRRRRSACDRIQRAPLRTWTRPPARPQAFAGYRRTRGRTRVVDDSITRRHPRARILSRSGGRGARRGLRGASRLRTGNRAVRRSRLSGTCASNRPRAEPGLSAQGNRHVLYAACNHAIPRPPRAPGRRARRHPRAHPDGACGRSRNGQRGVSRGGVPLPRPGIRGGPDPGGRVSRGGRVGSRSGGLSKAGGAAVPLRRGRESDGRSPGAPVALAHDAGCREAAHLSRSPPPGRRQPRWRIALRGSAPATRTQARAAHRCASASVVRCVPAHRRGRRRPCSAARDGADAR